MRACCAFLAPSEHRSEAAVFLDFFFRTDRERVEFGFGHRIGKEKNYYIV